MLITEDQEKEIIDNINKTPSFEEVGKAMEYFKKKGITTDDLKTNTIDL